LKILFLTFVNKNDDDCSLNIFEIVASIDESMKGIVNCELLIFWRYQMNAQKTSSAFWSGGSNMNLCSQLLGYYINIYKGLLVLWMKLIIFFLCWYIQLLEKMLFVIIFEILMFVNKNLLNDAKVCCKAPFYFVELIDFQLQLKGGIKGV
jgi:hypothetical protein